MSIITDNGKVKLLIFKFNPKGDKDLEDYKERLFKRFKQESNSEEFESEIQIDLKRDYFTFTTLDDINNFKHTKVLDGLISDYNSPYGYCNEFFRKYFERSGEDDKLAVILFDGIPLFYHSINPYKHPIEECNTLHLKTYKKSVKLFLCRYNDRNKSKLTYDISAHFSGCLDYKIRSFFYREFVSSKLPKIKYRLPKKQETVSNVKQAKESVWKSTDSKKEI
jgi:hypothetical protein